MLFANLHNFLFPVSFALFYTNENESFFGRLSHIRCLSYDKKH